MNKISIIYGELETDLQKKAIEVLSTLLLDYTLEYPTCFRYDTDTDLSERIRIYIGTVNNNPFIKQKSSV